MQAVQDRAQLVEGAQVGLRFGQADAGRDDLGVLGEDAEGLAAEEFGFLAHLGQAAAFFVVQGDEAGERAFERGQGIKGSSHLGVGDIEGNEVLGHGQSPFGCRPSS